MPAEIGGRAAKAAAANDEAAGGVSEVDGDDRRGAGLRRGRSGGIQQPRVPR